MEDWRREERLTRIARAAGYETASVSIIDGPTGSQPEGSHNFTGFGGRFDHVDVFVASWLSEPDAEATVLHELAHVELDHDNDPAYRVAELRDREADTDSERGPWEIDADALAAALAEEIAAELTDFDASLQCLADDAARYDHGTSDSTPARPNAAGV